MSKEFIDSYLKFYFMFVVWVLCNGFYVNNFFVVDCIFYNLVKWNEWDYVVKYN